MRNIFLTLALSVLVGCANSLPKPSEEVVGQLAIPIHATDTSIAPGYSYQYTLRFKHEETGEKYSVNVVPKTGLGFALKRNLPVGDYCMYGYFFSPIEREGRSYTFSPELIDYESCFEIKQNQLSVWANKLEVSQYDTPGKSGSYSSKMRFQTMSAYERGQANNQLGKLKNIEFWQPILFTIK